MFSSCVIIKTNNILLSLIYKTKLLVAGIQEKCRLITTLQFPNNGRSRSQFKYQRITTVYTTVAVRVRY